MRFRHNVTKPSQSLGHAESCWMSAVLKQCSHHLIHARNESNAEAVKAMDQRCASHAPTVAIGWCMTTAIWMWHRAMASIRELAVAVTDCEVKYLGNFEWPTLEQLGRIIAIQRRFPASRQIQTLPEIE
jgi:hypothetical protein